MIPVPLQQGHVSTRPSDFAFGTREYVTPLYVMSVISFVISGALVIKLQSREQIAQLLVKIRFAVRSQPTLPKS
jgi:hypothetical protein